MAKPQAISVLDYLGPGRRYGGLPFPQILNSGEQRWCPAQMQTSFATLGFFQETLAKNLLMKEPLGPRGSNENRSNVRFLPEKLIIGILTASGRFGRFLPLQSAAETPLLTMRCSGRTLRSEPPAHLSMRLKIDALSFGTLETDLRTTVTHSA